MSRSSQGVTVGVAAYPRLVPRLWSETIEDHRREVRAAILDATWALVTERGLTSVTMSQIAEETGIGRATLYKYFPDVETGINVTSPATSTISPNSGTVLATLASGSRQCSRPSRSSPTIADITAPNSGHYCTEVKTSPGRSSSSST